MSAGKDSHELPRFGAFVKALREGRLDELGGEFDKEIVQIFTTATQAVRRKVGGLPHGYSGDMALSAWRTILRRFREPDEKFVLEDFDDLTSLLVQFAYNRARNAVRRKRESSIEAIAEVTTDEDQPMEKLMQDEFLGAIDVIIEEIDDEMTEVVIRRRLDGDPFCQIADQTGLSERTVRRRWDLFRARMERRFGVDEEDVTSGREGT